MSALKILLWSAESEILQKAQKEMQKGGQDDEVFEWSSNRKQHCPGRQTREEIMIAALFVETDGCYFGLDGVDPWDEARDARMYSGPHPVVAHPPCQRWGALAKVNYARWGGEHNRPGNDHGCFSSALNSVNRFGGVLEHPAKSKAFDAYGISKPVSSGWQRSGIGWVCEVWQSAYGHKANKATWLYFVGTKNPPELDWSRPKGTHQVGFQDQRGKARNKPTLSKKEAIATPLEFRDILIEMARSVAAKTTKRG